MALPLVYNFSNGDELAMHLKHNMVRLKPLDICKAFSIEACQPWDREELMVGIRWNTLTPLEGVVNGIQNSCIIDGWLRDIKLRTLDARSCLGCLYIHTSGPGLKIEKTLRAISKFMLTCASPTPDAPGRGGGQTFQNKLVNLLHPSDVASDSEVIARISMYRYF